MKKILSILLISLLMVGTAYATKIQSPGVGEIMGQGKRPYQAHKTFRLVRWNPATAGTTTLSKENMVIWDFASFDDGVTITTSTTSGDSAVAGVTVTTFLTPDIGSFGKAATQDLDGRNWGYIQTYGYTTVDFGAGANDAAVAGGAIGCAAKAGRASGFGGSYASRSSGIAGFAYDLTKPNGDSVEVFLKCE